MRERYANKIEKPSTLKSKMAMVFLPFRAKKYFVFYPSKLIAAITIASFTVAYLVSLSVDLLFSVSQAIRA
jgi:hypothetical protein